MLRPLLALSAAMAALPPFATLSHAAVTISFRDNTTVVSSDSNIIIPGYVGTQDVSIDSSAPNRNRGKWIDHLVGSNGFGPCDGLTRFDVSALNGQYSQINKITLRLNLYGGGFVGNPNPAPRIVDVFAVAAANADWVEGSAAGVGGAVNPGEACWAERKLGFGTPWSAATLAASNVAVSSFQQGTLVSFDLDSNLINLTALMNAWSASAQNGGLRLSLDSALSPPASGLTFGSRDNPTGVEGTPELFVEYEAIPAPGAFGLAPVALLAALRRRGR